MFPCEADLVRTESKPSLFFATELWNNSCSGHASNAHHAM
jgi:hypothetical protein